MGIIDTVERLLLWWESQGINASAEGACRLRSPIQAGPDGIGDIFVTKGDDLVSFIEIRGMRRLAGNAEFFQSCAALYEQFATLMRAGGEGKHTIEISFRRDPNASQDLVERMYSAHRAGAKYLGAESNEIIDSQVAHMGGMCARESVYMVLTTHVASLTPHERKRHAKRMIDGRKKYWDEVKRLGLSGAEADFSQMFVQDPTPTAKSLVADHSSALSVLVRFLNRDLGANGPGLNAKGLDRHAALWMCRSHIDAAIPPKKWRPVLAGDHVYATRPTGTGDGGHWLPMPIGQQIVSQSIKDHFGSHESAVLAGWHYASIILEQCAQTDDGWASFQQLLADVRKDLPFGCNFEISPNGISRHKLAETLIAFAGAWGSENKLIHAAWKDLRDIQKDKPVVSMRVVLTTWAKTDDELSSNLAALKSAVESWGSTVVTNETGSPGHSLLATAGGFSSINPAPYIPGPLSDFTKMLPMFRPASPWDDGHLIARTTDGVPYPIQFFSDKQPAWGMAVFAPTGRGKSFLMMMMIMGLLMRPIGKDIPLITVLDVGPSSKLIMDFCRSMLIRSNPDLAKKIVSVKIRNDKSFAVNLFDTLHGLDMPTQNDIDFQAGIIMMMCSNLGDEGEMYVRRVITAAYKRYSRQSRESKYWSSSLDDELNRVVERAGIEITSKTRVWDVVDELFRRGFISESARAQRHAMPILDDLVAASADHTLTDYEQAKTPGGELIRDVFARQVSEAVNSYELLAGVTQYDLGFARAVSLDMEEVVKSSTGETAKNRKAIMYLYGRRLAAQKYFLRWDEVEKMVPAEYKSYLKNQVDATWVAPKFLAFDELHYTGGCDGIRKQLGEDQRVSRKYNLMVLAASQELDDLPSDMLRNCYNFAILGANDATELARVKAVFDLSDAEAASIASHCTGNGPFFFRANMNSGIVSQALVSEAGPVARWAFTTSAFDAPLRDRIARKVGSVAAAAILAKAFPSGSVRSMKERQQQKMVSEGNSSEDALLAHFESLAMRHAGPELLMEA